MSTTIQVKDIYAEALDPLDENIEAAVRRLAIERTAQKIAELRSILREWEAKYDCSYELFAYRTASDATYVATLDANPATSQWEGDLAVWEFYVEELDQWHKRLQSILAIQ